MTIPSSLEGNGAELQDNMMTYVLSKGKDMSTLIPAVIRMVYDYDPITSMWWSWKDYSDDDGLVLFELVLCICKG